MFNLKTMNYSTLKKTVALSFASLMAVGMANAQTDTSKAAKPMATDTTKMSSAATTAKVFGGTEQGWLAQQAHYELAQVRRDGLKNLKRLALA